MMSRGLCSRLALCAAIVLCPLSGWASQLVPWPQLLLLKKGLGVIDLERGVRIEQLMTVWMNCSGSPCLYEAFLHSVKGREDRTLTFLTTTPVIEINGVVGIAVTSLEYVEKETPGYFELGLQDMNTGKKQRLRVSPQRFEQYTVQYAE